MKKKNPQNPGFLLRKPIALLFKNEKKKISEKFFLRKPIALLFENGNKNLGKVFFT